MAREQQAGSPRAEGQQSQQSESQQSRTSQQASQTQQSGQSAASGAVESRGDRERQRNVSRESGAGTGMRTAGGRAGGALAGRGEQQSSLLSALMANPGLMASAFMSNPYGFAQAMSEEMDRLFATSDYGSSYGQLAGGSGRGLSSSAVRGQQQQGGRGLAQWTPQMEMFQRGNELVVRADLPGMRPEDVQIEIEDGVLTLSGERRQSSDDRQEGFYRSERSYGSFTRSIPLPDGVDEDQIQARFEHGELEVVVPLPQQRSRARRVQIQSGRGASASQQQPGERENGGQGAAAGRQGGGEQQQSKR